MPLRFAIAKWRWVDKLPHITKSSLAGPPGRALLSKRAYSFREICRAKQLVAIAASRLSGLLSIQAATLGDESQSGPYRRRA